jgi:hypothetical protein
MLFSKKCWDMISSLIVHKFSRVYDKFSAVYMGPLWVESVVPVLCVMQ